MIARHLFIALTASVAPLAAQTPAGSAQERTPLTAAMLFVSSDIGRWGVTAPDQVVFDVRRLGRAGDISTRFGPEWPPVEAAAVLRATGMSLGRLEDVRTCVPVPSGRRTCHLRPKRAVIVAGNARIRGDEATVPITVYFQTDDASSRRVPPGDDPFEVIHAELFSVEMRRVNGGWEATGRTRGILGTFIYEEHRL